MLKKLFDNFATSGWDFDANERTQKSRYEMFNITIMLSSIGLLYGLFLNTIKGNDFLFWVELGILVFNAGVIYSLRISRSVFDYATTTFICIFITLFALLIVASNPDDVKHIWVYTFPAVILFFKGGKKGLFWTVVLILVLLVTHIQTLYPTSYSLFQIGYICFVLVIMTAIIFFYQIKMDQDNTLIFAQKQQLESFAHELENKVKEKTAELRELNTSLEAKVEEKVEEIRHKDAMLLAQSRQAAMGEMLSMIAHQWRQPLSTVTLQIANLKIESMLNEVHPDKIHKGLENISDTVIYLSETIDDFQKFFHPEKAPETIELCELVQRALNFTQARLNVHHIKLHFRCDDEKAIISTYTKEVIQVIINILNNAADELVKIEESERLINVLVTTDHEEAVITIEDSGNGFESKIMPYIFEPYFSTKTKNGTGLGLYMGKIIIETHLDGTLSAENTPLGAKLTITLPLRYG